MTTLPPPSLPADARYRPLNRGVTTDYDRQLADITTISIPRGIVRAICAQLHHSCTPLQRPIGRPGVCRACDLIELAGTYSTVLQESA